MCQRLVVRMKSAAAWGELRGAARSSRCSLNQHRRVLMIFLSHCPCPLHPSHVAQALQVLLSVPGSPFPRPMLPLHPGDPPRPRPTSSPPGSLPGCEVPMLISVVPHAGAMLRPSGQAPIPGPPLGQVPDPLCASASSPQWMHL